MGLEGDRKWAMARVDRQWKLLRLQPPFLSLDSAQCRFLIMSKSLFSSYWRVRTGNEDCHLEHILPSKAELREKINNIYRIEPESKFGNQEQSFITKMNDIINLNVENPKFSVEDLAEKLNVSRVQLYRKVKAIIGINISDHINNVKLEKAAELLKSNTMNISEIAYSLGFSSPNYFSTAFKNKFGISPKEYKTSN